MKKNLLAVLVPLSIGIVCSLPAGANPQALGTCLVDSLDGKERKRLARWIYFSIAAHPEMVSFSNVSADDRTETDQYVGKLVTRLLVEDCASELRAARKADPLAVQRSFELVGQVAMQELMTNQDVTTSISNYANYADQRRINAVLLEE